MIFQEITEKMKEWNLTKNGTPPALEAVLVVSDRVIVRAKWIPRFTQVEDMSGDDIFGEYCEDDDCYFWPEGWYEWNNEEETHRLLVGNKEPTHWVALPMLPIDLEVAA